MLQIKNYKLKILVLSLLSILLSSCFLRESIGRDETVIVLAGQELFDKFKPQLDSLLGDVIYTPRAEKRFVLKRVSATDFVNKKEFRNILMLGDIDGKNKESSLINKFLSEEVKEGVRRGEYFFIVQDNLWARHQTVFFLLESKNNHLESHLKNYGEYIVDRIVDKKYDIIKEDLFDRFNNADDREAVNKKYGFDIYVPHDFSIINEGTKPDFVRFRRRFPDRWLTIIWSRYQPDLTFKENFIELRNRAGRQFGDSVRVNPAIFSVKSDTTFTQDGFLVEGIWDYELGGGPFFAYAFVRGGMLYLIDGSVYAPDRRKYPYLDQLKVMAKTFKFSYE